MFSKTRSLITGKLWKPKNPYCVDYLKYLHTQLLKNQVVDDTNVDMIIEVLRSTAELLIWGDQNDSSMFDFFFEKQMLAFFIRYMKQRTVARQFHVQLLQTLSILLENIRSQTTAYYLMSNNYLNAVITYRFDFTDEECMAYYITLLKTLSLKLDRNTVNFFFNEKTQAFPLYTESLRFIDHPESMVRIAVRNITLNVFRTDNRTMLTYVRERTASRFFSALAACMIRYVRDSDVAYRAIHSLQFTSSSNENGDTDRASSSAPNNSSGSSTTAENNSGRRSESPSSKRNGDTKPTTPAHELVVESPSVSRINTPSPNKTPQRSNTAVQLDQDSVPLSGGNRSSSMSSLVQSNAANSNVVSSSESHREVRKRSPRPISSTQRTGMESTPDLAGAQRANNSAQSPLIRMTQLRGRLTDLLQEHADQLHYINDVLTMRATGLNALLVRALCDRLINAVYLKALVQFADPNCTGRTRTTSNSASACNSTSSTSSSNVTSNLPLHASVSGRYSAATSPTESRKDIVDGSASEPRSRTSSVSADGRRRSTSRGRKNSSSDNRFTLSHSAADARQRFVASLSNASAGAASTETEDDPLMAIARSVNEHSLNVDPQLSNFLVAHALTIIEHDEVADPLVEAFFCSLSTVRALVQRTPSRHASGSASSTNSDVDMTASNDPQVVNETESAAGTTENANSSVGDTNVTDEEKLLKLRRSRFENSCTSHCCLLQALILECFDLEQRRGDHAALYLLCILFSLLNSSRLRGKFLTLLNLHTVSLGGSGSHSDSVAEEDGHSSSTFMMSLRVWLFDKLLTLIQQACTTEPRVRLVTFDLAVCVTRLLVLDSESASDTNAIRTAFESFYAVLCGSLRSVAKNDELFLDVFEYEYEQFRLQTSRQIGANGILTRGAFEMAYLNDTEILMPCMSTPVCGLVAHKRLPSGVDEQRRHSLRTLFRLRRELLSLAQLSETDLPLLHAEIEQKQFRISEKLDLDKRDLVAVDMTQNNQQGGTKSYFLTFDKFVFLLVEPDAQRIGWGVVRFVGRLQDTEIAAQKHDSRCLDVLVQRPFSASAQPQKLFSFAKTTTVQPLLTATFRFEDYIRCLAAKQRFTKARQKIRLAKTRLIVKLLDARLVGADSSVAKRKRAAAAATASSTALANRPQSCTPQNGVSERDSASDQAATASDAPLALDCAQSPEKAKHELDPEPSKKETEESSAQQVTNDGDFDSQQEQAPQTTELNDVSSSDVPQIVPSEVE